MRILSSQSLLAPKVLVTKEYGTILVMGLLLSSRPTTWLEGVLLRTILVNMEDLAQDANAPTCASSNTAAPSPLVNWCLPPPGIIKLNIDGAVDKSGGLVGVGIVARDHAGQILGTTSIPFPGLFSSRIVEALGFREALVTAANKGFSSIIVEG
ncbi:hypothetical protein RHMOL_Rhmol05G0101200 [Rhododendron molle]|uniref:Uncharacterized protein n=1 Tax=Rhododendron molle TaxID=49168 RepID=A0ACC0NNK7_RHOML|nr:hypothetical protein RHMOL_Rhmol05G0101200 [Rhododendron molle]